MSKENLITRTDTPEKKHDYHLSIQGKSPVVYITEMKDGSYEVETTSKKLTKVCYAFHYLLHLPIVREKAPHTKTSHYLVFNVVDEKVAVRLAGSMLMAQYAHQRYYNGEYT